MIIRNRKDFDKNKKWKWEWETNKLLIKKYYKNLIVKMHWRKKNLNSNLKANRTKWCKRCENEMTKIFNLSLPPFVAADDEDAKEITG